MLHMHAAGRTDTGKVRRNNEDSFYVKPPLLIVADGMGGAAAGEVASSLAVETIRGGVGQTDFTTDEAIEDALRTIILRSDAAIRKKTRQNPEMQGMGTTVVMGLHLDDRLLLANVGDSRGYFVQGAAEKYSSQDGGESNASAQTVMLDAIGETKKPTPAMRRVTEDHSVVMELVQSGVITEEDIRSHPLRNRITRCLGSLDADTEPDFTWLDLHDGDKVILCSDGLWEMVHEDSMSAIVGSIDNPDIISKKLVDMANNYGGVDNITVIAAIFSEES